VLVGDVTLPDAEPLAERIEQSIAAPIAAGDPHPVLTVTIGIVELTTHSASAQLLRDADTAMYRAKAVGKNRHVVLEHSPVSR
jgi:GGDEF domain-containing protein